MQQTLWKTRTFVMLTVAACAAAQVRADADDPGPEDYMWGTPLGVTEVSFGKTFDPADDRANFTFFSGVKDVRVEDGVLTGVLTEEEAVLGWGNYLGKQPPEHIADLPEGWKRFNMDVRAPGTQWGVIAWRNGKRAPYPEKRLIRKYGSKIPAVEWQEGGTEWNELSFRLSTLPPDGIEVKLKGQPGRAFEIRKVECMTPAYGGYFRYTFDLPDVPVWQALAQIAGWGQVYLNGTQIADHGERSLWYGMHIKDIRPHLQPGRNVIAVKSLRKHSSNFFLFQCNIALDNGHVVKVASDETWKLTDVAGEDWQSADVDDSNWQQARRYRGYGVRYIKEYFTTFNRHHCVGALTRLKNPLQKQFFYPDSGNVVVEVLVPTGLKSRNPVVAYEFARTDRSGRGKPVIKEETAEFREKDGALAFGIDLGRQQGGVYTFKATLKAGDTVLESRDREPLVVLRKFDPQVVAGESYTDGLDLELEDTIDFTDPNDPHPWFAGKMTDGWRKPWQGIDRPIMVTSNGLTYQVTADESGAYFAYRIHFDEPGAWYLLEADYPDDADRHTVLCINPTRVHPDKIARGGESWSECGVGYVSGGRRYKTGKMKTLRWLHVADSAPQVLFVQKGSREGGPAAVAALRVYRVKNDIPSIGAGKSRQFGILTERCTDASGFGHNFGWDLPERVQGEGSLKDYSMLEYRVAYLHYLLDASERYVQYLKFSGQNMYIMGVFQYGEGNTPMKPPYDYDTVEIVPELRTVVAEALDLNDIDFYLNFQWCTFDSMATTATDAEVARGADTVWRVNEYGEQKTSGTQVGARLQNWMHPRIQQRFREMMDLYNRKFGHLDAFKGIRFPMNIATGIKGYYFPGLTLDTSYERPFMYSYDDATFRKFEDYTGINLHISPDDPERFQKRALAVKNPEIREAYIAFRCRAFRDFFTSTLDALRAVNPDKRFILDMINEDDDLSRYWLSTGREWKDFLRDYAVDIELLDATPGMGVGRWTISYRSEFNNPYNLIAKTDPDYVGAYNHGAFRHVQIRTSWHESGAASDGYAMDRSGLKLVKDDWIPNYVVLRSLPQPSGYNAREAFVQALITSDPNSIAYGFTDVNLNVGHEQVLRDIMKVVSCLPREKFQPVLDTGLETNIAIRKLVKDGATWLYVANPGYWRASGRLKLKGRATVLDAFSGKAVETSMEAGHVILPVQLAPYGMKAYRASGADLEVVSYATGPITEHEAAHIADRIHAVKELTARPGVQLVLSQDDKVFLAGSIEAAERALDSRHYARAWSLVTDWRYCLLWQDFLEKAAASMALLPESTARAVSPKDEQGVKIMKAARVGAGLSLDGRLDEPAWQDVPFLVDFESDDRLPALVETGVKALYDGEHLYLGFICAERDTAALQGSERWTWNDDALVVFLQPDEKEPLYYQLGFNVGGGQFHQKVFAGEKDYSDIQGWEPAVAKGDRAWTAEVKLPFAVLQKGASGNRAYRINCHRVVRNRLVNNVSWYEAPGNWHNPLSGHRQPFGRLLFR